MTDDYFINEVGQIECRLDGSKFYSMRDFRGHLRSSMHRQRYEAAKPQSKRKKVDARSKIFNY